MDPLKLFKNLKFGMVVNWQKKTNSELKKVCLEGP